MVERLRRAAGMPDLELKIDAIGPVSFGAALAERFRDGRVFLTGDAAHRMTPRGAIGMNTAILSGHDVGWKLAWVHLGWAGDELLDTYEAERRPVAEHNIARSIDPNGSLRDATEGLHVDLGGRIPHVWLDEDRSTLDVLGPGLTRFTGPEGAERQRRGPAGRRARAAGDQGAGARHPSRRLAARAA